jgi:2-oxo-4-hydroxy-4-carboxy--5-ureidoimidazoline (OHCU) decarboxylase
MPGYKHASEPRRRKALKALLKEAKQAAKEAYVKEYPDMAARIEYEGLDSDDKAILKEMLGEEHPLIKYLQGKYPDKK